LKKLGFGQLVKGKNQRVFFSSGAKTQYTLLAASFLMLSELERRSLKYLQREKDLNPKDFYLILWIK
jgi:hypothetical protein